MMAASTYSQILRTLGRRKPFIRILANLAVPEDSLVVCAPRPTTVEVANASLVIANDEACDRVCKLSTVIVRRVFGLELKRQWEQRTIHNTDTVWPVILFEDALLDHGTLRFIWPRVSLFPQSTHCREGPIAPSLAGTTPDTELVTKIWVGVAGTLCAQNHRHSRHHLRRHHCCYF
jgi:hypothetical protein